MDEKFIQQKVSNEMLFDRIISSNEKYKAVLSESKRKYDLEKLRAEFYFDNEEEKKKEIKEKNKKFCYIV